MTHIMATCHETNKHSAVNKKNFFLRRCDMDADDDDEGENI